MRSSHLLLGAAAIFAVAAIRGYYVVSKCKDLQPPPPPMLGRYPAPQPR